jgi:hypothetical protein
VASLTWLDAQGRVCTPVLNSAYAGVASATLAGIFFLLAAFYVVAGSIPRDRERGLGAILAATPLPSAAYLFGKLAAHAAYLLVLSAFVPVIGLLRFLSDGTGSLQPLALVLPFLLVALPAAAFVAASAVLFDVTPGLRGVGGRLVWFFAGTLLLAGLPQAQSALGAAPLFDPLGIATIARASQSTLPGARDGKLSFGLVIHDRPPVAVAWDGPAVDLGLVARRALNLAWAVPPALLAVALFDRFDPARKRLRGRPARAAARAAVEGRPAAPARDFASLSAVSPRPRALFAVAAEARLIWQAAPPLKWLASGAALLAALTSGDVSRVFHALFLLLCGPLVAEVAAREQRAGTSALVFCQPGVPRSAVLFKLWAVIAFVTALGAAPLLRALASSPANGLALLAGLLFLAAFATGAAWLTSGSSLFLGAYTLTWYLAVSGLPAADFSGALGGGPDALRALVFVAVGAAFVAASLARERFAPAR